MAASHHLILFAGGWQISERSLGDLLGSPLRLPFPSPGSRLLRRAWA